ncbi:helix-turn-helix transcriptional regulator [Streptomyces sp. OfavH-34-F]|uniref:helix-turn-helix transcriptional regulator n=1 Tax=unclassified Streptomyces TaxID=2593676 RepID=UPI001EF3B970|nr:helix-turn-helix transcriptional regulator [Streptomyces sp. OfavH-34-F]MCG7525371.1 helix-turn-helix transcriptional regulator [Streptomyces sp. OfavH-34-F]
MIPLRSEGHDEEIDNLARLLYLTAARRADWDAATVGPEVGAEPAQVERAVTRLTELGLLVPQPASPSGYGLARPEEALSRLLAVEERILEESRHRLTVTRGQVNALMHSFPLKGHPDGEAQIELLLSGAEVNAFIEGRAGGINRRQLAMHPGGAPPQELVDEMMLRDIEVISRGVQIRALYPQHITSIGYVREYLTESVHQGADVRLAAYLPLRMILVDENLAILPIDPKDTSRGAFAIHSTEVARSLEAVFDFHWHDARKLDETAPAGHPLLTGQEQAIIRMLAMGAKDDAIARQLSISPRTLSRIISTVLDRLGVQSRFQAAVQLTKAGLLADTEVGAYRG